MDRRQFLAITAAGTLALGLPGASWQTSPSSARRALEQPDLLAILGNRRVREIGTRYRQAFPEESDVETLRAAILEGDRPDLLHPSTLRARLTEQVRDDFRAGRTVLLRGWVLSVAEARQCALFSLLHP